MDILVLILSGGFIATIIEAIKWWKNRRNEKRKNTSEAIESELKVLETKFELQTKHIQFLEQEIEKADDLYKNQTARLRQTQDELSETKTKNIEMAETITVLKVELERVRCEDLPCSFRRPPNIYTQPQVQNSDE